MMRITVSRSGGFAGITREWSVQLDERSYAEDWRELIDSLPWGSVSSAPAGADRFVYRVKCNRHRAVIPEARFDGPWQELLERVREADAAARDSDRGGDA